MGELIKIIALYVSKNCYWKAKLKGWEDGWDQESLGWKNIKEWLVRTYNGYVGKAEDRNSWRSIIADHLLVDGTWWWRWCSRRSCQVPHEAAAATPAPRLTGHAMPPRPIGRLCQDSARQRPRQEIKCLNSLALSNPLSVFSVVANSHTKRFSNIVLDLTYLRIGCVSFVPSLAFSPGWLFQMFRCSRKFSNKGRQKAVFYFLFVVVRNEWWCHQP